MELWNITEIEGVNLTQYKELNEYRRFTGPAEMQKAINSFLGLLEGITLDRTINEFEMLELKNWFELYKPIMDRPPFDELIPAVDCALADQVLTYEEAEDLKWLCQQVSSGDYFDLTTSATQSLHGVLHGLLADNKLGDEEICQLRVWLEDHSILQGTYPFDEVYSLISSVVADGIITEDERDMLRAFFSEFVNTRDSFNLNEFELRALREHYDIKGICAKNPVVTIQGNLFCFTGISTKGTRKEIAKAIEALGGTFKNSLTQKTNYLIVGTEGNPCWAFSCYGRKIEAAMELRKKGTPLVIVNENDFWPILEAH